MTGMFLDYFGLKKQYHLKISSNLVYANWDFMTQVYFTESHAIVWSWWYWRNMKILLSL